jgi:N-methylhydantoinase B
LKGGTDGATGGVMIFPPGQDGHLLSSKIDNMPVQAGTVIRDLCPSGGGLGDPAQRPAEARRRDRENDLIHR